MKIMNLKRLLGLVAISGGVAYVRKQGGLRPAMESVRKFLGGIGARKGGASASFDDVHRSPRLTNTHVTPRY